MLVISLLEYELDVVVVVVSSVVDELGAVVLSEVVEDDV